MKNLLFTSILVLTFSFGTFAQTNEASPCPTISVTGPPGLTRSGEIVTFTAELSKEADKFNPTYKWTVSDGEIVEGQGTLVINVLQKDSKEGFSATIEIFGLPKGCPTTFTVAPVISNDIVDIFPFDTYWKMAFADEKVRLQNAISQLEKEPDFIALFVINFTNKESYSAVKSRVTRITNFLNKNLGINRHKFKFEYSQRDNSNTEIYLLPKGFESKFGETENLENLKTPNKTKKSSPKAKQN
jgi:hypothetical protein